MANEFADINVSRPTFARVCVAYFCNWPILLKKTAVATQRYR
jgi:hypothetical protein